MVDLKQCCPCSWLDISWYKIFHSPNEMHVFCSFLMELPFAKSPLSRIFNNSVNYIWIYIKRMLFILDRWMKHWQKACVFRLQLLSFNNYRLTLEVRVSWNLYSLSLSNALSLPVSFLLSLPVLHFLIHIHNLSVPLFLLIFSPCLSCLSL